MVDDYCNYCNSCNFCNSCENLVNGFMCINLKFDKKDETKYWIFNKEVTKKEYVNRYQIDKPEVCSKCGQPLKIQ